MDKANGSKKIIWLIICLLVLLFSHANAIVRHPEDGGSNSFAHPSSNVIGLWGSNASCVAIAPDLVITTRHQGGGVGTTVKIAGGSYRVSKQYIAYLGETELDMRIALLSDANLTDYVDIYTGSTSDIIDLPIVIAGFGKYRADPIINGGSVCEYEWSDLKSESPLWCTNICERVDQIWGTNYYVADFDGPDESIDAEATTYEGSVAEHDSGGGWFVYISGKWKLVGLTTSSERIGTSRFRMYYSGRLRADPDENYSIITVNVADWINGYVAEHLPNNNPFLSSPANYSVTEGQRLSFNMYLTDPDGDSISVESKDIPAGAAFDGSTNKFSWNTNFGDQGDYTADFTATDSRGAVVNITINIQVKKGNRSPNIDSISNKTVDEGDSLSFGVSADDPDGDDLTYRVSNNPEGLTINSQTGDITWSTNFDDAGDYTVTVYVSDDSLEVSGQVAIKVNNTNRAPKIELANEINSKFTTGINHKVQVSDDDNDGVTVTVDGLPDGAVFIQATNTIKWVTDIDDIGSYDVTINANDGEANVSKTVKITIVDDPDYVENSPPIFAPLTSIQVNEGELLGYTVEASDADNDDMVFSVANAPVGLTINSGTGRLTWQTGYKDSGEYNVSVYVSDGTEQVETQLAITVINTNLEPVITIAGNASPKYTEGLSLTISAEDLDGDNVNISVEGLSGKAKFTQNSGIVSWTTEKEDIGDYTITVIANDGTVDVRKDVNITIADDPEEPANQAPVFVSVEKAPVNEGDPIVFAVQASDPDGDSVSVTVESLPVGAVFSNNTFTWNTSQDDIGKHTVTFIAFDGKDSTSMPVELEILDVNYLPEVTIVGSTKATVGDRISLVIEASDVDGDSLSYSLKSAPKGMVLDGNAISWQTTANDSGMHKFSVVVSDGYEEVDVPVSVTLAAMVVDSEAPFIVSTYPDNGNIQIPLNPLVTVTIADYGDGVDYESVSILIDGEDILTGAAISASADGSDQVLYNTSKNKVVRTGNSSRYTFQYQAEDIFDYDYTPEIVIYANDLNGNAMEPYRFSFTTEMFSMAAAVPVEQAKSSSEEISQYEPSIAIGANDVVWSAWTEGEIGKRYIKVAPFYNNTGRFDSSMNITSEGEISSVDIAVGSNGKLYLTWQDNSAGNWDIYAGVSSDGKTLDLKRAITTSQENQTDPVIEVSDDGKVYIAYVIDRKTGKDIFLAEMAEGLGSELEYVVCSASGDQDNPVLACDAGNVLVAWEDNRSGNTAIYAASKAGGWQNYLLCNNALEPDMVIDSSGQYLHATWNTNEDIYYSKVALPLSGKSINAVNIIDDSTGAAQESPSISHYSNGVISRTIVSWSDSRNAIGNDDNDIYFASVDRASMTNILATVDSDLTCQVSPAIAMNSTGAPYILFQDKVDSVYGIEMASATMVEATLSRQVITARDGGCVGVPLEMVNSVDDVSIVVPADALGSDVEMSISRVSNPPGNGQGLTSLFSYDFGPSSTREFRKALSVVIPYPKQIGNSNVSVFWYNPQTGSYSQSGMSGIETISINSQLNAIKFNTTHFSQYSISADFIPWMTGKAEPEN